MQSDTFHITTIDQYIASCPEPVRARLEELRATIRSAVPGASEKISYRVPTFEYFGNLVHFAVFKHHIGFYPTPSGIAAFASELARYKTAKGSVQFPIDEPLPLDLIARIVRFRAEENAQRSARPPKKRK